MFFDCTAEYVAYALLSRFDAVTKQERDVVQFILELIPCYDTAIGKLRMTRDAHILAQIYLAELRVLAKWHNYVHEGSLEDPAQARALLSIVVLPLVRHLSIDEYMNIVDSMDEAELLLSVDLEVLNKQVDRWITTHLSFMQQWRTSPLDGEPEWQYGYRMNSQFRIEDIATALPYPLKTERSEIEVIMELETPSEETVESKTSKKAKAKWRTLWKLQKRSAAATNVGGTKVGVVGITTYIPLPLSGRTTESPSLSSSKSEAWLSEEEEEWEAMAYQEAKMKVESGMEKKTTRAE